MDNKTATNLIKKTRDDYNKIADHFTSTRKKVVWADVLESLNYLLVTTLRHPELDSGSHEKNDESAKIPGLRPGMTTIKGKKILDVGSGSGRLYPVLSERNLEYSGIDLSENLVKNAKEDFSDGNFIVGDATKLPFKDCEFDYVVSVAVLYHIPSRDLRHKAVSEIYRATKPEGKVYVSVWYFWSNWKFLRLILKQALTVAVNDVKNLKKSFSNTQKDKEDTNLDYGDFFLPWKSEEGNEQTARFCHAWTVHSLKKYLKKAGFSDLIVIKSGHGKFRNINIICSK